MTLTEFKALCNKPESISVWNITQPIYMALLKKKDWKLKGKEDE